MGDDVPDEAPLQLFSSDVNQLRGVGSFFDPQLGAYRTFDFPPAGDAFWDGLRSAQEQGLTGAGQTMAIIDSGMLTKHPVIRARLRHSASFVRGEDSEDTSGHGTAVALLTLLTAPDVELVNLKVIGSAGHGSVGALVQALRWVTDTTAPMTVNMSVGIYSKRWLILDCKGDCKVCRAAVAAAQAGHRLVMAAGNSAGRTSCPATAAAAHPELALFAVAAVDAETALLAAYSGDGTIAAPVGALPLVDARSQHDA